jgi:predicted alpha/beta-fold hydrolase
LNWGYKPPAWLIGGHAQTIYPSLFAQNIYPTQTWVRQRISTADEDFIDIDWTRNINEASSLCVLFHGLEGNSKSHYAVAFSVQMGEENIQLCVPHFRGCSGEINIAPRAYHSGDYEEIDWILKKIRNTFEGDIWAVGISLGGNALLRWAQEQGEAAKKIVKGVVAVCAPLDLDQSGRRIGEGINHYIYENRFLRTMKQKARSKIKQYPGLFDHEKVMKANSLYEFDNHFTAPIHGFRNADDYWRLCSSKPHLNEIKIPHLVINALNDPFIPKESLPDIKEFNSYGIQINTKYGGHVGFATSPFPGDLCAIPKLVSSWMKS